MEEMGRRKQKHSKFDPVNWDDDDKSSSTVAGDEKFIPTPSESTQDDVVGLDNDTYHCSPYESSSFLSDVVPWPGHTFVIRDLDSHRMITIVDGVVRLKFNIGGQGGYYWQCVEKNGWLGFRDPVHGMYLGHNGQGRFIAEVKHHRSYEQFCVRKHPKQGYILLTHNSRLGGCEMKKMAVAEDGDRLVETTAEGAVWGFERTT